MEEGTAEPEPLAGLAAQLRRLAWLRRTRLEEEQDLAELAAFIRAGTLAEAERLAEFVALREQHDVEGQRQARALLFCTARVCRAESSDDPAPGDVFLRTVACVYTVHQLNIAWQVGMDRRADYTEHQRRIAWHVELDRRAACASSTGDGSWGGAVQEQHAVLRGQHAGEGQRLANTLLFHIAGAYHAEGIGVPTRGEVLLRTVLCVNRAHLAILAG